MVESCKGTEGAELWKRQLINLPIQFPVHIHFFLSFCCCYWTVVIALSPQAERTSDNGTSHEDAMKNVIMPHPQHPVNLTDFVLNQTFHPIRVSSSVLFFFFNFNGNFVICKIPIF